jgi:hypothetical protein
MTMTTTFEHVTAYLERQRSNALHAAEVAARRAGTCLNVATVLEIEEQLSDAERADRRLSMIEHRLTGGH